MTELLGFVLFAVGAVYGGVLGYVLWAPLTPFKRGFLNGISLGLWREK